MESMEGMIKEQLGTTEDIVNLARVSYDMSSSTAESVLEASKNIHDLHNLAEELHILIKKLSA